MTLLVETKCLDNCSWYSHEYKKIGFIFYPFQITILYVHPRGSLIFAGGSSDMKWVNKQMDEDQKVLNSHWY